MSVTLSPLGGAGWQFFDNNGDPLSGGKLYTYSAGTTTPLTTYTTANGNIAHTNPIILDAAGRVSAGGEIWLTVGVGYKFVLKTSTDVLIATYDNVPSAAQPPAANDADSIMYEQGYTVTAGSFAIGQTYRIATIGTTDFTAIGAVSNTVGVHFVATGAGLGNGTAQLSRTVQNKLQEWLSVKDFGAVGDGITDDTAAIQAANDAAAVNLQTVYFPAGLYKVNPLTATTSWVGDAAGATIKYGGTGNVDLVVCISVPNVVFENLIFDGNVSADPANWATGYNTFTGARGLIVAYSDNARIVNCHAQNNWHHGFKVDQSDGVVISGCTTNKNRGNFGDGFYNNACTNLKISNCRAYDFTRIGFVCDTDGANLTSYNILVENCQAEYGHDASINYGGGEYNAGLWFENTAHVEVNNYTAVNMQGGQGRGLLLCTGLKNNGVIGDTAKFSASNIQVQDCSIGVIMYSLGTFPISAIVDNANLTNVVQGVVFGLTLEDSSAICTNSHVDLSFVVDNGQSRAYSWGQDNAALTRRPSLTFANCTVAHINEIAGYLAGYGTTTACADVGCFTADNNRVGVELNVHNVRNVETDKPIWIGIPPGQDCNVNVTDCFVSAAQNEFLITGELMFSDCKFKDAKFGNGSAGKCTVKNSLIVGQCSFGGDLMRFENNQVVIDDTSYVWLFGHNYSANNPVITVSGCYFSKDINANDKVLRFQFGTVSDKFVVTDCTFFNSGAPSATNAFIQHATGEVYLFNGVFKDSTVTNMLVRDSGLVPVPLPTGVTAETFH